MVGYSNFWRCPDLKHANSHHWRTVHVLAKAYRDRWLTEKLLVLLENSLANIPSSPQTFFIKHGLPRTVLEDTLRAEQCADCTKWS